MTPVAAMRRGACPTLWRPMETGDGLLARLRVPGGELIPGQLGVLADGARRFGNGRIEITARGSLQIRGLSPQTAPALSALLDGALAVERGVIVETPPLAGLDPAEIEDPRPLSARLRHMLAQQDWSGRLAPKIAVIVDGGGGSGLDGLTADIRLRRQAEGWSVFVAENFRGVVDADGALALAVETLAELAARGPDARARDLAPGGMPPGGRRDWIGRFALADGMAGVGLGLGYGGVEAEALAMLARRLKDCAGCRVRLAPGHGLVVVGLAARDADMLTALAGSLGLVTDPADPRRSIAACAGQAGCRSGWVETQAIAAAVADILAPVLAESGLSVHVSGCAKGCAQPRPADLVLVGRPDGVGIGLGARAGEPPLAVVAPERVGAALVAILGLYRRGRYAQESALEWLGRLDPEALGAMLAARTT